MPTITTRTDTEEQTEVTPDFCYTKAAEMLMSRGTYPEQGIIAIAAEWRLLGDSLARK